MTCSEGETYYTRKSQESSQLIYKAQQGKLDEEKWTSFIGTDGEVALCVQGGFNVAFTKSASACVTT